jgi:hypothetical protein
MEQHPIPRQITTFEFKLIGFVTLKQFLYLLVAVPSGFVVFKLIPIPIINFLLAGCVVAVGAAFAFMSIEGRSLDIWAKNLYKRLTSPTQYTYRKHNQPLYFLSNLFFLADPHKVVAHVDSQEKLSLYLQRTRPRPPPNTNKQHIQTLLQKPTPNLRTQQIAGAPAPSRMHAAASPQAVNPPIATVGANGYQVAPLQSILSQKPSPKSMPPEPIKVAPMNTVPVPPVQQPIPQVAAQQSVQYQPMPMQPQPITLDTVSQVVPPTPQPQEPVAAAQPMYPSQPQPEQQRPPLMQVEVQHQQYVPPQSAPMTMPTSVPQPSAAVTNPLNFAPAVPPVQPVPANPQPVQLSKTPFFTGVVRNNKSIPIPGIMVYVKNQQGTPLRLLKTNPHGVFATFNSLPEGDYIFELKDPKNSFYFDTMNVPIRLTNPVPFEFRSKEIL